MYRYVADEKAAFGNILGQGNISLALKICKKSIFDVHHLVIFLNVIICVYDIENIYSLSPSFNSSRKFKIMGWRQNCAEQPLFYNAPLGITRAETHNTDTTLHCCSLVKAIHTVTVGSSPLVHAAGGVLSLIPIHR